MTIADESIRTLADWIKRHWLWIVAVLTVGFLVSAFLFQPISRIPTPTTIGWIGALGLQLSAWGLVVSVIGFALTLWQLQRTQGASVAAANAFERIKRDYSSFDLVTEVRTARAYAEAAQGHVSDGRWGDALANYNNLRASLNKLAAVKNGLSIDQLENARDYIATTLDTCQSIDSLKNVSPEQIPSDVLNGQLRELDGFLITLEYSLKDAIRGHE